MTAPTFLRKLVAGLRPNRRSSHARYDVLRDQEPEVYVPPEEVEEWLKADFPYRTMSPEEYVARRSHFIGCFGLWRWKLRDAELSAWLVRVHENLQVPKREECGARFLTTEELAEARRIEREAF